MKWMLVLLAVLVAGCGDAVEEPPELPPTAVGTGIIRGIVVDAQIRPVAGATVTLVRHDATQETGEDGTFVFTDLEPGSYFLRATKPGWSDVQSSAEVQADDPEPLMARMLLERIPGTEPYVEHQKLDGFIVCSIGHVAADHDCDVTGEQQSSFFIDIEGRPDWIQTEIQWDSTQPAGDNLYVIHGLCTCDGDYPPFDQRYNETADARSVYVVRAGPDFLRSVDAGGENGQLFIDVSASGPAVGTGMAFNQEFVIYLTFFFNVEPEEGWTFYADGPY